MRVFLDARTASWSGVGRYVTGLLSRINKTNSLDVLVLANKDLTKHERVKKIYARYNVLSVRGLLEVSFISRQKGIDIIHSPMYVTPFFPSSPLIVTIHDLIPIKMPEVMGGNLRRNTYYSLNKLAVKNATAILVPSNSTKKDVLDVFKCSSEKIHVIPHAIDDIFLERKDKCSERHDNLQLGDRYLLSFGNAKPNKNLEMLLKAYAITKKEIMAKLVLIGSMAALPYKLKVQIKNLKIEHDLTFTGRLTDEELVSLYSRALAFIFPSVYEGFGLPPLEAMACTCPVACSHSSSLPEVVGDSALLFDPYSLDSIVDAILKVSLDDRLRSGLIEKGQKRACKFTWDNTFKEVFEIYKKILA